MFSSKSQMLSELAGTVRVAISSIIKADLSLIWLNGHVLRVIRIKYNTFILTGFISQKSLFYVCCKICQQEK